MKYNALFVGTAVSFLFVGLFCLFFFLTKSKQNSPIIDKLNNFSYIQFEFALNNSSVFKNNKNEIMEALKNKFNDNIIKRSECILKIIKNKTNKTENDILNMSDLDLVTTITNLDKDAMTICTNDNQLNFIFLVLLQSCDINYNNLFSYVKQNISIDANIIEVSPKFINFLKNNKCETSGILSLF